MCPQDSWKRQQGPKCPSRWPTALKAPGEVWGFRAEVTPISKDAGIDQSTILLRPLSTPEGDGDRAVVVLAVTVDTVICLASEEGSEGGRRRL